jgi:hypothetical protein
MSEKGYSQSNKTEVPESQKHTYEEATRDAKKNKEQYYPKDNTKRQFSFEEIKEKYSNKNVDKKN